MNVYRKNAKTAGILFLVAMFASLTGGVLLDDVLNSTDYLSNIIQNRNQIYLGISLELLNAVSVMGIAVTLLPVLRRYNNGLTFGYFVLRIIEAVFCIVAAIIPFMLISLSAEYLNTGEYYFEYFQMLGSSINSIRENFLIMLIPIVFSLGALLFYYLLYNSKLIPRFISVWGFIASMLIFTLVFLEVETSLSMIFVLPIIFNEIFLGIWLIFKGFYPPAINLKYQKN